jgi:hypothetical protein
MSGVEKAAKQEISELRDEAHNIIAMLTNADMDEVSDNIDHPYRDLMCDCMTASLHYASDVEIMTRKGYESSADIFHEIGRWSGHSRREFTAKYSRAATYEKLFDGILHEEIGALIMLKALGLSYEEISEAGLIEGSPSTIYRRLTAAKLTPHHLPPMLDGEGTLAAILARGHVDPPSIYILAVWRFSHFSSLPHITPVPPLPRNLKSNLIAMRAQVHLLRLIHRVASGGVIEGLSKADLEVLRRLATAASLPFDYDSVK